MLHRYRLPAEVDVAQFAAAAGPALEPARHLLSEWQAPTQLRATFWIDPMDQATLIEFEGPEEYLPALEQLPGIEPFGWNTPAGDEVEPKVWQERHAAWRRARTSTPREWALEVDSAR